MRLPMLLIALIGASLLAFVSAAKAATLALVRPAAGPITSGFGGARGHEGVDFGRLRRLGIIAAAGGRVLRVGYQAGYDGYGKIVVVAHANGYRTLYAHLSSVAVRPGQRVWAGRRLGIAGCTGHCTGTHLHFEVRHWGRAINPVRFF
ncbi:MAG: M23 family metallopeptidase [Gaiellaceae bacterium]